jgi:hypothetical protein
MAVTWGKAMAKFEIGHVAINVAGRKAQITDRQKVDSEPVEALAHLAELETPDGFRGTLGIIEWPDGSVTVRLVDFMAGPDTYRRLERAGTLELKVVDGHWVALIRAMKYEARDYATLHGVTFDELSELIKDDARQQLLDIGNVEIGEYGTLVPGIKRYTDAMALKSVAGYIDGIAGLYALTRVMPLMKNFGRLSVIGMD